MTIASARWLGLSYFTYFFCYGIYLPFWSVWLQGSGLDAEKIGLLLGCGMVARFAGSLLIASQVKNPAQLIVALRLLALLTALFALGFWFGGQWLWLLLVMVGFNLFFSPLVPLSDALAATWTRQIGLAYGPVRLWGSLAFVISSALTGMLVSAYSYQAVLLLLSLGVVAMLSGMLLPPQTRPQGEARQGASGGWAAWRDLLREKSVWRFMICVTLLQGAHAAYYSFSAIWWQQAGYSASVVGYLWSLGVVAEIVVFALSNRLFRRWSARDLLLLSGVCALLRWTLLGATTALPLLVVAQILHCGSFTICHLAAMRFIAARKGTEVIRLQSLYSALAMGGGIAVMTMICGVLFAHLQGHLFWVMALVALPALFLRPAAQASSS
ncbi:MULTISPECIES: 3-phenylpropionate MFS transporter [Pantoea]|jgi:PPP family 3-phenylpropionic acid transporter|uniref:3-phenylpropionate MFS transporter n=1 Tax=Pantoea TaxID=53335 RepID=UPI0008FD3397|nr:MULTISPECIES: 3-phenylpropionate MFS transporter [Pantoea]KAA6050499.1 3-phenylpropionate MFS transporter [Pantoea sp. Bo_7]KAA6094851.1 3-phenylpropionate MFS transporter [Pantoea sp. Bo_10]MCL9647826.1 3-phenylpropionate MFS transporter [Pantoea eucrina]MDJ0024468.1 3-phenylpropionate MFS transporter [Pantoea eucrina]OIX99455.1 3-phenylpropionic acid transporter [Pantoea sp. Ae16]